MEKREGERLAEQLIESSWDVIFEDGSLKLPDEETVDQKGIDINDVEKFGENFAEKFLVCLLRDAVRFRLANFYSEVEDGEEKVVERFDFEDYTEVLTRMVEPMLDEKQMKIFEYGMKRISKIDMEKFLSENYEFDKYKVNKVCHSETEHMKKSFPREQFESVFRIQLPIVVGGILTLIANRFENPALTGGFCVITMMCTFFILLCELYVGFKRPEVGELELRHLYNKNYLFEVLRKFDGWGDFEVGILSRNLSEFVSEVLEFKDGAGLELDDLGTKVTDVKRSLFECMEERFTLPEVEEEDMGEGQSGEEGSEEVQVERQEVPEQVFATADRGEV